MIEVMSVSPEAGFGKGRINPMGGMMPFEFW
jgi:hypothetical protein